MSFFTTNYLCVGSYSASVISDTAHNTLEPAASQQICCLITENASETIKSHTMPTSARRGPKPNPGTRKNLIQAGRHMLHRMGYSATGIKDIVDEAGVPKGSFYNHFDSKEAFAGEIIDDYFEQALPQLIFQLGNSEVSPIERLRAYFNQRAESFITNEFSQGCLLGNFSLEVADHSINIRARLATHFDKWSELIEKCIAEAQESGEIKSSTSSVKLARFVLNSWEGALVRMRAEKSDDALNDFMDVIFNTVLI